MYLYLLREVFPECFKLLLHIFLYLQGNLCLQAILKVGASTANSSLCISEVDEKWWGLLCVQNQSKCIFKKKQILNPNESHTLPYVL